MLTSVSDGRLLASCLNHLSGACKIKEAIMAASDADGLSSGSLLSRSRINLTNSGFELQVKINSIYMVPGGVHDLRMDGGLPHDFQKGTLI